MKIQHEDKTTYHAIYINDLADMDLQIKDRVFDFDMHRKVFVMRSDNEITYTEIQVALTDEFIIFKRYYDSEYGYLCDMVNKLEFSLLEEWV